MDLILYEINEKGFNSKFIINRLNNLLKICTNCPSFSLKNEKSRNIVNVLESVFSLKF